MDEDQNTNLNSWDDFLGSWLKADEVVGDKGLFICMSVRSGEAPDGKPQVILKGMHNNKKYEFSLNATNMTFIKKEAKLIPNQLVDKKIFLVKDKVYNPSLKKRVDGLFIEKIE